MKAWPVTLLLLAWVGAGAVWRQTFRKEPMNRTSIAGETSLLECEVDAASGPVQWVKDGLLLGPDQNLPGFPRYSMTGDRSTGVFNLQITRVGLSDEGRYLCQVGRSDSSPGLVSQMAWLHVLVPPRGPRFWELAVGRIPTWVAGEEYSLTCEAEDSKPESRVTVSKGGVNISAVDVVVKQGSNEKVFSTVSTVRFTAKSSDNGKRMACSAMNQALHQPRITHFTMNVLFPPQKPKIKGYNGQPVNAGVTLELICTSGGGNPLATLQWLKGDGVLSRNWGTGSQKGTVRSVLLYPVTPEDNGAILGCEAANHVTAAPLRTDVTLRVVFPPDHVEIIGLTEVLEGSNVSVTCQTSSSNPPAHIRWWAFGVELNVTKETYEKDPSGWITTSSANFMAQRSLDGTSLVCEAVNQAVVVSTSASVPIAVFYVRWFRAPERHPLDARKRRCLRLGAARFRPVLFPPEGLEPAPVGVCRTLGRLAVSELTIVAEPSDNQAEYQCSAHNPVSDGTLSAHTRVTVQFAPISLEIDAPASVIREGENLTLVCRAGASNPATHISWIRNGQWVPGGRTWIEEADFGGWATVSSISLVPSGRDDGQRIRCQAFTPVLGDTSNTFLILSIRYAPQFQEDQVRSVEGVERAAVVIPLRVSANPRNVTYTWSRNREVLVKAGPTRHHLKSDGSLEIWNLTRFDAGVYKINVKNDEGENETFIRLEMLYSPRIYSISDPTEVEVGGTVEMVCTVDANPVSSKMVQWIWMGQGRNVTEEDQVFMGNTTKLVIRGAVRGDTTRYRCTADNGIPPAVSVMAQLIVQFKPELQKGVELGKSAVAADGTKSAILRCKAEGVPDVEFSWAKNGVNLDPSNPRYTQRTTHEGPLHTGELTIGNASAALDFGTYSCTARNPLGTDIFDIQLVRTGPPDPPSDLTLVRKSHNSVTLAWSSGFNGGLTQSFRVRYSEWDALSALYVDVYPPWSTHFTVTGLRPGTRYNFSVNAINALGASGYADGGLPITVSTSGGGPFPSEPMITPELGAGGFALPLPILVPVTILITSLLLLNIGILVWILWKMKAGAGSATKAGKSMSADVLEMNDYTEDTVGIDAAQSILNTNSAPSSSTYESYYNCSLQSSQMGHWDHRLNPAGIVHPGSHWETGSTGLLCDQGIYEDVAEDPAFLGDSSAEFSAPRWLSTSAETVHYPRTVRGIGRRVRGDPASRFVDRSELLGDLV
ncbi:nephrin [Pristis pectinata]|uniref:nephrin n=1 Tax=Pristis pectinata TaxID=685728 RepID=UPI00223E0EA3|nr:nephrin [Pristis pectinata]